MKSVRSMLCGSVMVVALGVPGIGQLGPQKPFPQFPDPAGNNPNAPERDPNYVRMQEQASKTRNSERQKRLVADTDKLLTLATELKQDVDKTDKNTLSVDVIKKAEEIEKLAHSVKERMKG